MGTVRHFEIAQWPRHSKDRVRKCGCFTKRVLIGQSTHIVEDILALTLTLNNDEAKSYILAFLAFLTFLALF